MTLPARPALTILLGAALLGILGDALLRHSPWGVNFALWIFFLAAVAWVALRTGRNGPERSITLALGLAVLFAAGIALRDSGFLRTWDLLAVLAALSLATLASRGARLATGRVRDFAGGAALTGLGLTVGAVPLLTSDTPWTELTGRSGRRRMVSLLVGTILAVPVAIVFGGLFSSADPVFETVVDALFGWDLDRILSHLVVGGLCAWIAAGYARGLIVRDRIAATDFSAGRAFGILELGIPLGLLLFLLVVFVAIQVGYLFGGNEFVQQAAGPTYASYARRGFFELVAASALVLPILLGAWWALDTERPDHIQSFRALALTILLLVSLVMVSALARMRLYLTAYGLTEDRLYATAFMLWIGFVLAWFAWTVLRARPEHFAFGSIVSGFALLVGLNVLNPDALIVRTNVARAARGQAFDVSYVDRLSADAVPVVVGAWDGLSPEDRCTLARGLLSRTGTLTTTQTNTGSTTLTVALSRDPPDARTANVGRWRARRTVRASGIVESLTACPARADGDHNRH